MMKKLSALLLACGLLYGTGGLVSASLPEEHRDSQTTSKSEPSNDLKDGNCVFGDDENDSDSGGYISFVEK